MSARPIWKGSIKLSLITIPIRVFAATNGGSDVSFRQLHRRCHTPIQLKKWCPHCEEEVSAADTVKGYESSKGTYVLVEEEEIKRLRPDATHVIDISHVLDASVLEPVYVERVYYLTPDTKAAGSPFAVLREALADKAGVGRLAIHGREYLGAVVPRDRALLLYTLRTAGEVRDLSDVDGLDLADVKVKPDEVKLARRVLESFEAATPLSSFHDQYEEALRQLLESKGAAATVAADDEAKPAKVVNLMDALRQSLARVSSAKKTPARAAAAKGGRVLAHSAARTRRKAS